MKNSTTPILILLALVLVLLAVLWLPGGSAYASGAPLSIQAAPTPIPPRVDIAKPAFSLPPIFAVLVLIIPAWFMVWKARKKKKIEIKAASCLPVVDDQHPL